MINDASKVTARSAATKRFAGRMIAGLTAASFAIAGLGTAARFAAPARAAIAARPGVAMRWPDFGTPLRGTAFTGSPVDAPSSAAKAVHNNALYGVSCITWSRCVAVGARVAGSALAFRPLAERWTGTRWLVMPSPSPARLPRALLAGVSCQSGSACVAVGYHYSAGGSGYALLAERWDGKHWRITQSRNPAGLRSAFFNAVTCAPKVGCIAVGGHAGKDGQGHGLADRWTAGRWRLMRPSWPAGAKATELNGVSCFRGRCVVVGMYEDASGQRVLPLAELWTGQHWQLLRTPSLPTAIGLLYDVSCGGPGTCMAVGLSEGAREFPLAELWQGNHWRTVAGGKVAGGSLSGVSCQVSTWCMAAGAAGDKPLTETWFGVGWQRTRTPVLSGRPPAGQLSQLSCRTRDGRCVTVGARYQPGKSTGQATLAEWWNGTAWRIMRASNP